MLVEDIKVKDLKGEEGTLSAGDVEIRKKFFSDLWRLLKSKELMVVQRSRSRWLREGDANTCYFHKV
jgi:hypothetical protein